MPEIKRLFNASRMNRDVDDRLVQAGEYREALNINVSKSEGSDMGAVENLLGNKEIVSTSISNAKIIGSLRDNGNEKIYCEVPSMDMKNKGTILEPSTTNNNMTNAQITYGYNETIFTDVSSNPVGVIDFNDPLWLSTGKTGVCAKKEWCDTYDIIWDGVTNYSKCD